MQAVHVSNLYKSFESKIKPAGFLGSLKSLAKPSIQKVEAVKGISFDMDQGELLGLIGPNGAGKSTTIKILTGILHPTSGEVQTLGFVPWKQRRPLAYQIGTVFGQRPQLWYHLPAIDTFYLFGKIYELEDGFVRERVNMLAEAFEIGPLLETPVRKLSLGQRMRCEIIASLLHSPRLLLLDEPSIGLDIVAKQHIRDTIKRMNEFENVGVILTSHDASDIEALCKRVIIINHGQIVYQDKVSNLKRSYLTSKQVDVKYAHEIGGDFNIPGMEILKVGRYGAKLSFDIHKTPMDTVITKLAGQGNLVDLTISDPSLEEVIHAIYEDTRQDSSS
ncbi:MAG: ATP-binding cassette domain-containing protein [Anaerolineae bacterium]|nr:ATP-binding cassette domain-containing protein [Anaerolineae bacterium]